MPGSSSDPGDGLEDAVREHQPGEVQLARAERGHLPVEDGDRLEVAVDDVADPGVAPAQHRSSVPVGALASSHARPRSMSGERPPSATAKSYQARVRARFARSGASPAWCGSRKANVARRPGCRAARRAPPPCCPAAGAAARRPRRTASCRRSCRAARRAAPTPSTRSIRKNGVPSTVAGRLHPADRRHRHVGELADEPHRVELVLELVRREDRHVLGRRARPGRRTRPSRCSPSSVHVGVEDEGLGRHAVGVDAGVQRDRRAPRRPAGAVASHSASRSARCRRRGWSAAS